MFLSTEYPIPLLKFSIFSQFSETEHFITTRKGGTSQEAYKSLNLSFSVGDNKDKVIENRKLLASAVDINNKKFVFQNQQHGNLVRIADYPNCADFSQHTYSFTDSDALITNKAGICLFVFAADCVPILLYDARKKIIAAVHSGWRGTAKKIIKQTIRQMQATYGSIPQDIFAGIGPAIRSENYEVGSEVAQVFYESFGESANKFIHTPPGKKEHIDLYKANSILLQESGVPKAQTEVSEHCTFQNSELFFSARRNKLSGRFGAGIMLKNQL